MNYYFAYGLSIATEIDFPELFAIAPTDTPQVSVRIGKIPIQFVKKVQDSKTNLFISPDEYYLRIDDTAAYYAINGNEVIIEPTTDADLKSVRLFFLSNTMAAILYQREYIPMHASAIYVDGGIALFLGDSGAGKSTTVASLQTKGHRIFSDDICVPIQEQGVLKAFAAYPMMKLWKDTFSKIDIGEYNEEDRIRPQIEKYSKFFNESFDTRALPIKKIFILEKLDSSASFQSEPIKGISAFKYLRYQAYRLPYIKPMGIQQTYFNLLSSLLNNVPLVLISRPDKQNTINEVIQLIEESLGVN